MSGAASKKAPEATVLSLAQLLQQQPASAPPCLVEPGLLPPQGILFVLRRSGRLTHRCSPKVTQAF